MGNPIEFRELLVKMHNDRMTTWWGAYAIEKKFGYTNQFGRESLKKEKL